MKRGLAFLAAGTLLWGIVTSFAYAQRGMGERAGVARQAIKPKVVTLTGNVLEVKTEPCKMTTGPAYLGTHFLMKTPKGDKLNIHLGPTDAVTYVTEQLPVGGKVTINAFRTAKMPENEYVAQSVAFEGATIQLRDENLRPLWAGSNTVHGRSSPQWVPGRGRGRGWGRGWKRGPGYGRGRERGWGRQGR